MSSSSKNWLGVKLKRNKEILLNPVFLKNRILELGIKQWWLAEQVGVDRKTVIRWVQGKVFPAPNPQWVQRSQWTFQNSTGSTT